MSGPLPQPGDSPETLKYRHWRSITGIAMIFLGIGLFVGIQLLRAHQEALLAAQHLPVAAIVPPNSVMQFLYYLAIPVLMPLCIILCGVMLFSPTVAGQVKSLMPWNKGTTP